MKRKRLTKSERMEVFKKYNGRCAYCGEPIVYNEMQVDHLIPFRKTEGAGAREADQIESMANYMPSCRSCNHYKRGASLEAFRTLIETIPDKLERDSYIYKIGCRYQNIKPEKRKIVFYFERGNEE